RHTFTGVRFSREHSVGVSTPCSRQASSSVAPSGTRTVVPSTVMSTSRRGASRKVLIRAPPSRPCSYRLLPVPADQAEPHRGLGGADRRLAQAADRGVAGNHGD